MNIVDFENFAKRLVADALAWLTAFWTSIRNGEFQKRLKIWWRANWGFALLAFVLASGIYFLVRGEINYNGQRAIPVVVQVVGADGVTSVSAVPAYVTVFVRGAENDVRRFETSDLPIRLSLKAETLDRSSDGVDIAINKRKDIPGLRELGLVATHLSPEKVRVAYDPPANVEFFIEPPMHTGMPYHGDVKEIRFSPQSVTLRGGKRRLDGLRGVVRPKLPPIEVDNLTRSFEKRYSIILPPELEQAAQLWPPTNVLVSVTIVRSERTTVFDNLPVSLLLPPGTSLPQGHRLVPSHISAKLVGYDKSMAALSRSLLTAYARISSASILDFSPGATNTLAVNLSVPPDQEIWSVETLPSAVRLIMPAPPPPPVSEASGAGISTNLPPAVPAAFTNAPAAPPSPLSGPKDENTENPHPNDKTEKKDTPVNG